MSSVQPTHDTLVAIFLRGVSPHLGFCRRCGFPWSAAKEHVTSVCALGLSGIFALCEGCWLRLSINQRLPYYEQVLDEWAEYGPVSRQDRHSIIQSVMEGG